MSTSNSDTKVADLTVGQLSAVIVGAICEAAAKNEVAAHMRAFRCLSEDTLRDLCATHPGDPIYKSSGISDQNTTASSLP